MAKVTVLFGNDPQSERTLDKAELRIGRAMDCDIVVDNLGVSRHHCSIVQDGENWALVDKGSNNGTFINGQKVDRHPFKHLDRVVLGKHSLVFDAYGYASDKSELEKKAAGGAMGGEMTMFVDQAQLAKMAKNDPSKRMALSVSQGGRDVVVPLNKDETTIGKQADVPARGFLVKPVQAKLVKSASGHRLVAFGGMRSVRVNGKKVNDAELKNGDVITIAGQNLTYKPA
ncbi:MAG: FHA domain-containing protein [Planctomycetes bacterium]|nr:FHA domain-containing protein [Planctomycetota bacterium]